MTTAVLMAANLQQHLASNKAQHVHVYSLSLSSALQRAVDGCSDLFSPHITGDLLQLLFTTLTDL